MKKIYLTLLLAFIFAGTFSQTKSFKRGVAYGHHSQQDMEEYSKFISWWYNWSPQPEIAIRTNYQDYNIGFAPMAWNSSGISGVKSWVDQDSTIKYILGFNEPNFKEQANMVPSKAAAAWPAFQQIAEDNDLQTVSPAVNYCGNCVTENGVTYTNPFEYLDDFFAACTDCKVDFIGLHWYGSGSSIMSYVEDARKYGKPMWVTEFASWDYNNPVADAKEQIKYLAGTANYLEREPDIFRYSWFIGRTSGGISTYPYIDLYASESGMLTELGQMYADIPVYDPDKVYEVPGRIEAEEYLLMSGLFSEPTEDEDGFLNIGWTDVGDWAAYKISVPTSGTYTINVRIAGGSAGVLDFLINDESVGKIRTPYTGGWQSWKTISTNVELEAGEHMLKLLIRAAGYNINWIEISSATAVKPDFELVEADVFPNPVTNGILNVRLNGVNAGSDFICSVIDVRGTEIFTVPVKPDRNFFQLNLNDTGNLSPGMYYLTITGKNTQAKKKFVVR